MKLLSDFATELMNKAARGELPKWPLYVIANKGLEVPAEDQDTFDAVMVLRRWQLLTIESAERGDVTPTSMGWGQVTCPRALALKRLRESNFAAGDSRLGR